MKKPRVTRQQMIRFWEFKGKFGVATASAKAGFDRSTGYRLIARSKEEAENPSEQSSPKPPRKRTRVDPLASFWSSVVLPLLVSNPSILAVTVYHHLLENEPGFKPEHRRTLERRIREWKAKNGPEKEVMFPQEKKPAGAFGIADFTHMNAAEVTINGEPPDHMFFHFRLPWSGYRYASVVLNGESFSALAEGLHNALDGLGGAPGELRTDSLSAAFRNLSKDDAEDMTVRYQSLCAHYGMTPSRNNRGVAHENGAIESAHGHLKSRVRGALQLRGSNDFKDVEDYRAFIAGFVARENVRHQQDIDAERVHLTPLPPSPPQEHAEARITVTSSSGFHLHKVYYSVPSRLIGYKLKARIFDDRIELFHGSTRIETLPRGDKTHRPKVINYHHVIHSLKKKPMALARLSYRDGLFPRDAYRNCFHRAMDSLDERKACRLGVGLLALAHEHACEAELAAAIEECLRNGALPDIQDMRARFALKEESFPVRNHIHHNLDQYASLPGNFATP